MSGGALGIAVSLDAASRVEHCPSHEGVALTKQLGDDASDKAVTALLELRVGLCGKPLRDLPGRRGEHDAVNPLLGTLAARASEGRD